MRSEAVGASMGESGGKRVCRGAAKLLRGIVIFAGCFGLNGCHQTLRGGEALSPSVEDGSIAAYVPPKPEEWTMPNGVRVMYVHDPELPLVRGGVLMRAGTLWDSPALPGGIGALGGLMRQGGAGPRTADQLDRELEKLSAGVASAAGAESLNVTFGCLSSDLDAVFGLFSDVLLRPRFEQGRLDLWKGQNLEAIRRRVDEPSTVAGLALGELLYGWGPYGRFVLEEDIQRISRPDLVKLHSALVVPDGAIVTIVGDVTRERVEALLSRYLGGWAPTGRIAAAAPPVDAAPTPGIYFVNLPFVQSTIYMGELGVPRLTPDYHAIEGFNELFGASGFSSMLMQRIRTELGLAYSIYGAILPGPVRGKNVVALQTKSESVGTAIIETLKVLDSMQQSEVSREQLDEAKRSISNSFIFRFDNLDEVLNRRALQTFLNYPPDYDATFLPKLAAVTAADIRTVAQRRWNPDKLVIVVVGDGKAYASLQETLAAAPEELAGYQLRPAVFDGKLREVVQSGEK